LQSGRQGVRDALEIRIKGLIILEKAFTFVNAFFYALPLMEKWTTPKCPQKGLATLSSFRAISSHPNHEYDFMPFWKQE